MKAVSLKNVRGTEYFISLLIVAVKNQNKSRSGGMEKHNLSMSIESLRSV